MKNLLATILILSFATFSFSQSTLSFSKKQQSQYLKHIKNNKTIQTKFKTIPKPIADLLAIKLSQYMAMSKESQLTVATESLKCQNKQGLISTKRSAVYSNFINGKINSSEAKEQLKSLKISSEYDAQLNSIFQEIPDNTTSPPPTSQGKWGKAIGGLIGAIVGGVCNNRNWPRSYSRCRRRIFSWIKSWRRNGRFHFWK